MANRTAIAILGSARSQGNTRLALDAVINARPIEIIDLNACRIAPYDYDHTSEDDFATICQKISRHDVVFFATPVYWYAMSGILKVFFDRLTDLLKTHKHIGRALASKHVYAVVSGTDPQLPPGFETPFDLTSRYFGMAYKGAFYNDVVDDLVLSDEARQRAVAFGDDIFDPD